MFACWESFDRHRVELVPRRGHDGHFIELLLVHGRSGYVPAEPTGDWRRSPVFGRLVRLDRARDRLGLWKYTLRFKSA
jgi:hypothetical protein